MTAEVPLNDSSCVLSKYLGGAGSHEPKEICAVRGESFEPADPYALSNVSSELTFETGNPAVVGTFVP